MSHQCPRNGCKQVVARDDKLMCRDDWRLVPAPLQRAVWEAWDNGNGRGTPAHAAAIQAAIRAVNRIAGAPEPAPSPHELWRQADGDPGEYRRLMRVHGHVLKPGNEGYEDASRKLPCGRPGRGEKGRS